MHYLNRGRLGQHLNPYEQLNLIHARFESNY